MAGIQKCTAEYEYKAYSLWGSWLVIKALMDTREGGTSMNVHDRAQVRHMGSQHNGQPVSGSGLVGGVTIEGG